MLKKSLCGRCDIAQMINPFAEKKIDLGIEDVHFELNRRKTVRASDVRVSHCRHKSGRDVGYFVMKVSGDACATPSSWKCTLLRNEKKKLVGTWFIMRFVSGVSEGLDVAWMFLRIMTYRVCLEQWIVLRPLLGVGVGQLQPVG